MAARAIVLVAAEDLAEQVVGVGEGSRWEEGEHSFVVPVAAAVVAEEKASF